MSIHTVDPQDVLVRLGTITVLKTGERIPNHLVRLIITHCQGCKRPITDKRELTFTKQTRMCFVCCTGNSLDLGQRWSCRTVHNSRLEEMQHCIRKYCGERALWETQPFYGRSGYTEFHWSWHPEDSFIRIGYHVFRLLHNLTRAEADEAFRVSIYEGFSQLLELTRPPYERWRNEKVSGDGDKHRVSRRGR